MEACPPHPTLWKRHEPNAQRVCKSGMQAGAVVKPMLREDGTDARVVKEAEGDSRAVVKFLALADSLRCSATSWLPDSACAGGWASPPLGRVFLCFLGRVSLTAPVQVDGGVHRWAVCCSVCVGAC